jgi:polar amino acid transport system substrate-binding protein
MRDKRNISWIMKWLGVAAVFLVAALAFAACGDDDDDGGDDGGNGNGDGGGLLEQAREAGSLTIGIADEAPYGFEDESGNATGEAPEVAKAVLAELGIPEIDFVVVEFGSLIPGLNAGQFDMIAAGMFITPDRAEQILFSDPDYCGTQAFAVAAGNPLGITDFDSIAANPDIRLGVLGGAIEVDYAEAAGVDESQLTTFDTTSNVFEGLLDGRIDAVALTTITINWQVQQIGDDSIEATEGFVPVIDGEEQFGCGGYGFRFENQDFRDEFNSVLNDMKANDEILPIVEQFGFTASVIDQAKDVTVEDLTGAE